MNDSYERLFHPTLLESSNVNIRQVGSKKGKLERGLEQNPIPVSPRIGPYVIEDPLYGSKNYFWCSCGLSQKQPFCDRSHKGTKFAPVKFSLDEKVERMVICGCKLSSKAPYCDGETC
eukprot:NODE_2350_length_940_cov_69.074074_g1931_i0.p2 GENE.NODE_2350_length_940_cov_69.074074_g1931_i0~~NODE_2350_length_940_cov_69.074074_g1931_i0.p2  ORF type:complete len:118 (-),score=3.41 NODE_2350_length_940_cov_69.074074_g1931_i0:228-581(-)